MADTQFDWADPLRLDSLLTDEERMVRDSARRFCDEQLVPRVRDDFRHERFDRAVVRSMGELGFFGATPSTRPTVRGSRSGNAALSELLAKLAELGLLIDETKP